MCWRVHSFVLEFWLNCTQVWIILKDLYTLFFLRIMEKFPRSHYDFRLLLKKLFYVYTSIKLNFT